jgi:hypothetical protein
MEQSQRHDILLRLVYCHMLGYDVSFSYIHAVKQAQQGTALEKKVGELMITHAKILHQHLYSRLFHMWLIF